MTTEKVTNFKVNHFYHLKNKSKNEEFFTVKILENHNGNIKNLKMITNIKRTMFHEIGHYTARQLNYKICKNGFGAKEINFKAKDLNDDNTEFEGQTVANKPLNYSILNKIKNPAEHIAVLVYGCIFGTIFENRDFCYCFNGINGSRDLSEFNSLVFYYLNKEKAERVLDYIKFEYFNKLKLEVEHFEKLFNLNFENILIKTNIGYTLDIEFLEVILNDFLEQHSRFYKEFLIEIKNIIE